MNERWIVLQNSSEVLSVRAALLRTRQEPE